MADVEESNRYDRGSKWLIDHAGDSILRLAGAPPFAAWNAVANEAVQPRQTPDGLLEVWRAGRKTPDYAIVEFQTYPDRRVPRQLIDDVMLTFQTKQAMPDLYLFVLKPKGNLRVDSSFEMTSPGGSATIRVTWQVIEAWTLSADDLLAKEEPGLVPWAMLGQTALPPEAFLTECRRIVEEKTPRTCSSRWPPCRKCSARSTILKNCCEPSSPGGET